MYGHTYSKSMDQPGKVASPARGQLNRKNEYFPVRVLVKCGITCFRATLQEELGKRFESLLMTLLDGLHTRQSSLQIVIQVLKYW